MLPWSPLIERVHCQGYVAPVNRASAPAPARLIPWLLLLLLHLLLLLLLLHLLLLLLLLLLLVAASSPPPVTSSVRMTAAAPAFLPGPLRLMVSTRNTSVYLHAATQARHGTVLR
jgi:hypothetical protein